MRPNYKTANDAFDDIYNIINDNGIKFAGTRALFNVGFLIEEPWNNDITTKYRKWSKEYAEAEWQWYLSGDPSIEALGEIYGKVPPIWERMAVGPKKLVNSNYGYQWERGYQLDKVVQQLKDDPTTRKAAISIYDGKEINKYRKDTPCTYAVQFTIVRNKLEMCVTMRSNDIWYGFCNDQYCFSQLQKLVSERTGYTQGGYYHFAHNMHIYEAQLDKNSWLQRKSNRYE